jgi:hypothetical protein
MANGLTNLIPDAYAAMNVVSRELVGFIPSVTRDARVERAAVGQLIRSHVAPASAASDITPAVTPPNDGDQTIGNLSFTISKSRRVPFRWNGEEQRGINNGGPGVLSIQQDQIAQAMRALVNEIEADLAGLHVAASRAYGTPGTVPFNTVADYTDASNLLKILLDNGTPNNDLQMVINTAAGSNLRGKQGGKANEAGTAEILRRGVLLDIHGFSIRESAQIKTFTAGSFTGTVTVGAHAVGTTALTFTTAAASAVALTAGDIITIAGDTNKYVVAANATIGASTSGTVTIGLPGLRIATSGNPAPSVVATTSRMMGFRRSAIMLAQRLPALPDGGDMARDRTTIQDPVSGLVFEIAMYPQYRQMQYEISCAWGVGATKAEHIGLLVS